ACRSLAWQLERLPYNSRSILCQLCHLSRSSVQLWINPRVASIEPDTEIAVLAPCRSRWLNCLLGWISRQISARRCQTKVLLAGSLANEMFKKAWPFEPPVAK